MTTKQVLQPKGIAKPAGVWSPAIVVTQPGRMVFLSGFTSRDETGNVICEGDIRGQTRQVCENLKKTIEAAGGTLKDLVSVCVFVKNIKNFDDIHAIRREYFPVDPPSSTMVEVTGLVDPRMLIEINAIAVLP
jgi:enamine deaminase RidA (YjgF/YER057c/UK114 family)